MTGVGKTGEFLDIPDNCSETIKRIRKYSNIKVQVGFGIENIQQIEKVMNNGADGVIIGSRIIKLIDDDGNDRVREYV